MPTFKTLSDEQTQAVEKIREWYDTPNPAQQLCLGGYAGTGKTTVISEILREFPHTTACAPTGKAAHVLRKKGVVGARTIHSTIYRPSSPDSPEWILKPEHEVRDETDLFIVDEASMVSREVYNDLMSFEIPVLFVGDPGQLEPVGDNPNLMADPDFVLQTIHRQAEGNPILQFSKEVREGGKPKLGIKTPELVSTSWPLPDRNILMADQIIVGTNSLRRNWNTVIRQMKGFSGTVVPGEKLICLRNDRRLGVYNGQMLSIIGVLRETNYAIIITAEDDSGVLYKNIALWKPGFEGSFPSASNRLPKNTVYCDYGYVITCHKSQGSEWDKVIVVDPGQIADWDMRRWRYTAITRAAEALVYCL